MHVFCWNLDKFVHPTNLRWGDFLLYHSPYPIHHSSNTSYLEYCLSSYFLTPPKTRRPCSFGSAWWIVTDPRHRLTLAAGSELLSLRVLLHIVVLSGEPDQQTMLDGSSFSTRRAYAALSTQLQDDQLAFVWGSSVPQKVKIFGWLLSMDRPNTMENLHTGKPSSTRPCARGAVIPGWELRRDHLFFLSTPKRFGASSISSPLSASSPTQYYLPSWSAFSCAAIHCSNDPMGNLGCEKRCGIQEYWSKFICNYSG